MRGFLVPPGRTLGSARFKKFGCTQRIAMLVHDTAARRGRGRGPEKATMPRPTVRSPSGQYGKVAPLEMTEGGHPTNGNTTTDGQLSEIPRVSASFRAVAACDDSQEFPSEEGRVERSGVADVDTEAEGDADAITAATAAAITAAATAGTAGAATTTAAAGVSTGAITPSRADDAPAPEVAPVAPAQGEEEDEEEGRDTHYVGFEGDRTRVVVVDKKATVKRWLFGIAGARRYSEVWKACYLNEINAVLIILTTVSTVVAYTCTIHDKRLFLIPAVAGAGTWFDMLMSRSPRLLRILAVDFGESRSGYYLSQIWRTPYVNLQ